MTGDTDTLLLQSRVKFKRNILSQGATKTICSQSNTNQLCLCFEDRHPLNALISIPGKGVINNRFSASVLSNLEHIGIETHFIQMLNMRDQLVCAAEPLPFYVEIHAKACDDFADKFAFNQNAKLQRMIPELRYKNKSMNDPVVSPQHLLSFGMTDENELDVVFEYVQRINDFLQGYFFAHDLELMRYKLEFGLIRDPLAMSDGKIVLIDEISLDTCRVLDLKKNQRLDVFASDISEDLSFGYRVLAQKFNIIGKSQLPSCEESGNFPEVTAESRLHDDLLSILKLKTEDEDINVFKSFAETIDNK